MTVLNFSYADIKDAEKFQQYVQAAAALMAEFDVEVVVRGKFSTTMRGESRTPHIAAVFRYRDMAAVEAFYNSEKYKTGTTKKESNNKLCAIPPRNRKIEKIIKETNKCKWES